MGNDHTRPERSEARLKEPSVTVVIKAKVDVDDPADIGRPRWRSNELLPDGRELIVTIRDLALVFSEPAARWLLGMMAAIIGPDLELDFRRGLVAPTAFGAPDRNGMAVRVRAAVHVYHPGDVNRPRWEHDELVITLGTVTLVLSQPVARRLLVALTDALTVPSATPVIPVQAVQKPRSIGAGALAASPTQDRSAADNLGQPPAATNVS
jgi:hypothetical protein